MKLKLFLVLALMAVIGLTVATQQNTNAATGNLDVVGRVSPTLRITPVTALDFGDVFNTDSINPGFIHVSPSGAQSVTNVTQNGASLPGSFDLRGRPNAAVTLTLQASIVLACAIDTDPTGDCLGGTNTVTMDQFAHNFSGTMPALPGLQTVTVNFGGRMSVAADQNSGIYQGQIVATANY